MAGLESIDTLIIGGGLAGIVCALDLLDSGQRIHLIDRDVEAHFGGLAKESFGGLLIVGTPEQKRAKIKDTPEIALRDWLGFGEIDRHDDAPAVRWPREWATHYVNHSAEHLYHYLKGHGLKFLPMPLWVERGSVGEGNSVPRWHVVWGTGHGLVQGLLARLSAHPQRKNLTLAFGHKVDRLLTENGAVVGAAGSLESVGHAPLESFECRAANVIVATGGINGSLERVRAHWHADWGQPPATLLNGSHRFADGTLHDASQAVGAQITHLDKQWNYAAGVHHWQPRKPNHGLSLVPPKSALWLNWRGERILAPWPLVSGFDTRDLVTQISNQGPGYSWQVLNQKIALKELAISGAEFNGAIRDKNFPRFVKELLLGNQALVNEFTQHCPDVVVARSLSELVDKMNALQGDTAVDAAALMATVAQYDAQIERGPAQHNDDQLRRIAQLRQWKGDRLRTCNAQKINDAKAMPLIAIREFIISRKSLGGIQTDLSSRVLDAVGQPISGLYAVGEAAGFGGGGMNGLRGLEGTFLGGCIYSARRAAAALSGRRL